MNHHQPQQGPHPQTNTSAEDIPLKDELPRDREEGRESREENDAKEDNKRNEIRPHIMRGDNMRETMRVPLRKMRNLVEVSQFLEAVVGDCA